MGNPFKKINKKAEETKKVWGNETQNSKVVTLTCKQCGAPRPQQTNLTNCSYCNYAFMQINATIKE